MKGPLYRKIFKALNEDLNMILSDDEFEEPEIDLGVHIANIQKTVYINDLIKRVDSAIKNRQSILLKHIIEEEWDGENPIFFASNDNIKNVVWFSVQALGEDTNLNWIDVSHVTDMTATFYGSKFNGDISKWDVSNVQIMRHMFSDSKFNGDISGWDVSSVTNMQSMFYNSRFNGDISEWDVSNVKNMKYMFEYSKFNGDISKWDVSSVIDMRYMFLHSQFNGDISGWNVSNVTDMEGMFASCPIKKGYKPKFNGKII